MTPIFGLKLFLGLCVLVLKLSWVQEKWGYKLEPTFEVTSEKIQFLSVICTFSNRNGFKISLSIQEVIKILENIFQSFSNFLTPFG